jgi:hypothetical protein
MTLFDAAIRNDLIYSMIKFVWFRILGKIPAIFALVLA